MHLTIDGVPIHRHGIGELRRFGIKGCDVAFFAPHGITRDRVLSDVPHVLELHYVYPIRSDRFARAAWKTLERNESPETLDTVREDVERLHGWYRDVSRGDRYRLSYVPGKGTTLSLNGDVLGQIEGHRFACIYLGIWLGKRPLSKRLRENLLGHLHGEEG